MPGTSIGWFDSGHIAPEVGYYAVEASQTIFKGDWLVLVQEASNYNTPRVKKVTSVEIAGDVTGGDAATAFSEDVSSATVIKGILGIALADVVTDSAGVVSAISPSTIAANARATYAFPTISSGLPLLDLTEGSEAEDKGKSRLPVAIANDWTAFKMKIAAAADGVVTLTTSFVGRSYGIQIANTIDFKVSTGETANDAIFQIVAVDETSPYYNTSSINSQVYVKVKQAYQQARLGLLWLT